MKSVEYRFLISSSKLVSLYPSRQAKFAIESTKGMGPGSDNAREQSLKESRAKWQGHWTGNKYSGLRYDSIFTREDQERAKR